MSQLESIKRMLVIITKVRSTRKYTSQQELLNEVNDSMDIRGYKEISAKTLERDLRHIEEAFGLTIGFDARLGRYAIKDDLSNREERMEELLFNFDLLNELDSHSPLRQAQNRIGESAMSKQIIFFIRDGINKCRCKGTTMQRQIVSVGKKSVEDFCKLDVVSCHHILHLWR